MQSTFRWLVMLCLPAWPVVVQPGFAGDLPAAEPAATAEDPTPDGAAEDAAEEGAAGEEGGEDFEQLRGQWTELLSSLRAKLIEYRNTPEEQRGPLREEYNRLVEQGAELLPRLIDAAERAVGPQPQPTDEPVQFLAEVVQDKAFRRPDYESAARLGRMLAERRVADRQVLQATGVALYHTGEFAAAAQLLEQAAGGGELRAEAQPLLGQAMAFERFRAHQTAIVEMERLLAEADEPDPELVRRVIDALRVSQQHYDDFEPAARIARMLLDKEVSAAGLYDVAGVAFFMTNQFDSAKEYLNKADEAGRLTELGRRSLENIDYYREIWEEELKFRADDEQGEALPRVLLETNKGDLLLELFENQAPKTVGNFVSLVERGFYDGLVFHRVLPGFMAQGGDPQGDGSGGPGYTIVDEVRQPEFRKHFRGYLSMAKTPAPDSGGSQFFLTFAPTRHLDGQHTVFGRVIEGIDVLAKLQRRDPGPRGPVPDRIIRATVVSKRDHEYKPTLSGVGN